MALAPVSQIMDDALHLAKQGFILYKYVNGGHNQYMVMYCLLVLQDKNISLMDSNIVLFPPTMY
jgi:hypothetical protein